MSMLEAAELLKNRMGDAAKRVPLRKLPDWLLRAFALVNPEMRQIGFRTGLREAMHRRKGKTYAWFGRRVHVRMRYLLAQKVWCGLGLLRDSLKKGSCVR